MEEQLITKLLQILGKQKITVKGNILSIGNQKIKIPNNGSQKISTRPIQLR